jgi:hypothetical protein
MEDLEVFIAEVRAWRCGSGLLAAIRAGGRRSYRLTGTSLLVNSGTP